MGYLSCWIYGAPPRFANAAAAACTPALVMGGSVSGSKKHTTDRNSKLPARGASVGNAWSDTFVPSKISSSRAATAWELYSQVHAFMHAGR